MIDIDIDDSQVQALFSRLTGREQEKALKGALRTAGNLLVKTTRQILKRKVRHSNRRSIRYGKSLQSGVKCKLVRENNENVAKVHIMGDFRLKFFEKGTANRTTHGHRITGYRDARHLVRTGRGGFRGKIKSSKFHFFDTARRIAERPIFSTLNRMIAQSVLRVASRH